jgi:hypothetical protein
VPILPICSSSNPQSIEHEQKLQNASVPTSKKGFKLPFRQVQNQKIYQILTCFNKFDLGFGFNSQKLTKKLCKTQ